MVKDRPFANAGRLRDFAGCVGRIPFFAKMAIAVFIICACFFVKRSSADCKGFEKRMVLVQFLPLFFSKFYDVFSALKYLEAANKTQNAEKSQISHAISSQPFPRSYSFASASAAYHSGMARPTYLQPWSHRTLNQTAPKKNTCGTTIKGIKLDHLQLIVRIGGKKGADCWAAHRR
jgi:hypothetical protein